MVQNGNSDYNSLINKWIDPLKCVMTVRGAGARGYPVSAWMDRGQCFFTHLGRNSYPFAPAAEILGRKNRNSYPFSALGRILGSLTEKILGF